jgi:hypothetical protein
VVPNALEPVKVTLRPSLYPFGMADAFVLPCALFATNKRNIERLACHGEARSTIGVITLLVKLYACKINTDRYSLRTFESRRVLFRGCRGEYPSSVR